MSTVLLAAASTTGCISIPAFAPPDIETVTLESSPRWFDLDRVVVIDLEGFITTVGTGSMLGLPQTSVADVRERLDRAAADWRVRAVVLRINSPGGEVTASDTIYRQIRQFREESGIPVVAHLMSMATSGGYYAACACDRIVASPTCVTGSVGVIMQLYNAEGLLAKVGLRRVTIKSGDKKDIASMTRAITDEERRILQAINQDMFARFVKVVRGGRPAIAEGDLERIKDGRVMTASAALKTGMVDSLGYLEDAIGEAKKLAGIETADVIAYRAGFDANVNLYAGTGSSERATDFTALVRQGIRAFTAQHGPGFLYLWAPSP